MRSSDFAFGPSEARPYVIAFANEKGGTGKSTLSFHTAVALLRLGFDVATLDADARQGSLSRYLENRRATADRRQVPLPRHVRIREEAASPSAEACEALGALAGCDFVVIDTPGSADALARFAVLHADTLVSPVNDSYVDLDVIAALDLTKREVVGPGRFTQLVWQSSNRRTAAGFAPTDWVVLRNRLTHIDSQNKRDIADLMGKLASRIGFRVATGFGERVIYRELFHSGLTVFDGVHGAAASPTPSHVAARAEVEALLAAIGLTERISAAG